MLKIVDLFTSRYEGCPYTVINVGNLFIITMSINGNLHRGHVVVLKSFWQRLLGKPYTQKQLNDIHRYTSATAESTIDTVLARKVK